MKPQYLDTKEVSITIDLQNVSYFDDHINMPQFCKPTYFRVLLFSVEPYKDDIATIHFFSILYILNKYCSGITKCIVVGVRKSNLNIFATIYIRDIFFYSKSHDNQMVHSTKRSISSYFNYLLYIEPSDIFIFSNNLDMSWRVGIC